LEGRGQYGAGGGGISCMGKFGSLNSARGVVDMVSIFTLIFMECVMTVTETNCFAEGCQNSLEHLYLCRLIFRSWKSWQQRKYCCSGIIHGQWLIQNPTLQSYFSTKKNLLMSSFSDVITSEAWNSYIDSFTSLVMKRKIHTTDILKIFALIYKTFQELFLPKKDISLDKSVTL
jgi:hypothetical protein